MDATRGVLKNIPKGRRNDSHNDVWIAACALQLGMHILSRDTDFDAMDELTRIGFPDERKRRNK